MNIQIAFFDLDGTLLDPATHAISPKTAETLARLRRRGIRTCLVTGRDRASLPDFGSTVFDAFAVSNAALCYVNDEVIFSNAVEPREVDTLLRNAAALGLSVSVAVGDRISANLYSEDMAGYYALAGLELTVDPDFDKVIRQPVYKVMVGCRPQHHEALLQGTSTVKLAISWDRAVDIVPKTAGKGAGIRSILAHFGLKPSQAMAFGDSYNDLEMLQAVSHSVAMGNAVEALKASACAVCPPVSQDGIYQYCLQNGLI